MASKRILLTGVTLVLAIATVSFMTFTKANAASPGPNTLVSVTTAGGHPTRNSYTRPFGGLLSGDGRYVAFDSSSSELVAGDASNVNQVFLKDTATGTTVPVSPDNSAVDFYAAAISNDGKKVLYRSTGSWNSFRIWNSVTNTTQVVWGNNVGGMSADGRFLVFSSNASVISGLDTHGKEQVYIKDALSGAVKILSVDSTGNPGLADSQPGGISCDGGVVAFTSGASNLPGNASVTGSNGNMFVSHLGWGSVDLKNASGYTYGEYFLGNNQMPQVSCDGNAVAYSHGSTVSRIMKHDRLAQSNALVVQSDMSNLPSGVGQASGTSISGDGRYVAFSLNRSSSSGNFSTVQVADTKNSTRNSIVYTAASILPTSSSLAVYPSLSADARTVIYSYKTPAASNSSQELISGVNSGASSIYGVYSTSTGL